MGVSTFEELKEHYGHKIECVMYGDRDYPLNVAIECEDCCIVLLDYDCPEGQKEVYIKKMDSILGKEKG